MEIVMNVPTKITPAAIRLNVAVRYGEEDIPNDFPFRRGDVWNVTVDIDTGKIHDWPQGKTAKIYMKVCDQGNYYLLSAGNIELVSRENDYVPSCIPGEYGDYIEFDIAEDGTVANWKKFCTPDRVRDSFTKEEE